MNDLITIRIAPSVCEYVGTRLGNLNDYCADGLFDPRSNAYKLGMRTHAELEDLQRRWPTYGRSGHATRNVQLTRVQWMVILDRILFAHEIASDNGADGDREAARFARTCAANMQRISVALGIGK